MKKQHPAKGAAKPGQQPTLGRRDFLRNTALMSAGVATLGAASSLVGGAEQAVTDAKQPEQSSGGYRLTEHIAAYYKTASS